MCFSYFAVVPFEQETAVGSNARHRAVFDALVLGVGDIVNYTLSAEMKGFEAEGFL